MRQIVLDTETTGLSTAEKHRIIEIGCVEMFNRRFTGKTFHVYLQPDREIDAGALQVHGITPEFLADKPRFADKAQELMEFLQGAELVIHNASFDVGFLNYELSLLPQNPWQYIETQCSILDTLLLARQMNPGQKASLDALCKRYGIDNTQRQLHGALLDAQLLAEVYLAMTGGQVSFLGGEEHDHKVQQAAEIRRIHSDRPKLPVIMPSEEELNAHLQRLTGIEKSSGGKCLWLALDNKLEQ